MSSRRAGLLQALLAHEFDDEDILQAIERFEALGRRYAEAGGTNLDADVQAGILNRNLSKDREIGRHLLLNTRRLDTYENIRDEVIEIKRVGLYCSRGAVPVPMDLDPLNRSKGKPGNKGWGGKPVKGGGKGDAGKAARPGRRRASTGTARTVGNTGTSKPNVGSWRAGRPQCTASRRKIGTTKMTRTTPALGLLHWAQ